MTDMSELAGSSPAINNTTGAGTDLFAPRVGIVLMSCVESVPYFANSRCIRGLAIPGPLPFNPTPFEASTFAFRPTPA